MNPLDPESVDLADLARQLARVVPPDARSGSLRGRTIFRDATVTLLHCSELEAEQLVDTLVARGFLALDRDERDEPATWTVRSNR
jgi:hypothetical protein